MRKTPKIAQVLQSHLLRLNNTHKTKSSSIKFKTNLIHFIRLLPLINILHTAHNTPSPPPFHPTYLGFCDFFISKPRPPPLVDCSDVEDRDDDDVADPPIDDPDDDDDENDDDDDGPVPAAAPKVPATELNEYRFLLLFIAHLALHITTESESFRS